MHTGHWDPIMRACEETGTVVCLHIGSSGTIPSTAPDAPVDVPGVLFFAQAMFVAVDWLYSRDAPPVPGPQDLPCPKEGIGWVAGLLDRLDHMASYQDMYGTWTGEELSPRETFQRNFWHCAIDDTSSFVQRDRIGVDRILLEADYPHCDTTWPDTQERLWDQIKDCTPDEIVRNGVEERIRALRPSGPSRDPTGPRGILMTTTPPTRRQLHQPRLAELVAGVLRDRILGEEVADGARLPKQEALLEEFGVSKPSLREALRILEAEGLLTIQRGNVGGAVAHVPTAQNAAYTLALVLQARAVGLRDVAMALSFIEPLCAALCASRPDRADLVVPQLRQVHAEAVASRDDLVQLSELTRRFHEMLVDRCGNETMILLVGALEALWSGGQREWAEQADPDRHASVAETSFRAHEQLIDLIEAGDADAAQRLARTHLEEGVFYSDAIGGSDTVSAAAIRADGYD
ncbi:MAG: FCD domain-containing protein [Xanthomonadales bacterium]|nr:FCD domain-containing protein [Xanthomonadales bacterium]